VEFPNLYEIPDGMPQMFPNLSEFYNQNPDRKLRQRKSGRYSGKDVRLVFAERNFNDPILQVCLAVTIFIVNLLNHKLFH
jgi:hypothetical protein